MTWVTLVPKKSGVIAITDYRAISMVGSLYKVIAKIMSARLRKVLPRLIGDTQTAFVAGRQILDGAMIANEVVHHLKQKKKAGVLMKLDFQKAYDIVSWESLELVLEAMGFGSRWRSWVRKYLRSASISILINGSPSKPFRMERGLRQGDPLSPFLFTIIAEVLSRMLQKASSLGLIRGLSVGKQNIYIYRIYNLWMTL